MATRTPEKQIILRLTNALDVKRKKWTKDLISKRVSERDGYIVAINDGAIHGARWGSDMPFIVKALYGFGARAIAFDRQTLEMMDSRHQYRPTLAKQSGEPVSSQPFAADECPEVSAVLCSHVDAANHPERLGGDFIILHNERPHHPLPREVLRFAREYWQDGEYLHRKDYSDS